jgi:hypothetical protein
MAEWDHLSPHERAQYFAQDSASEDYGQHEPIAKSPQVCLSSSTAVPETPKYITEAYEKARKRINEGTSIIEVEESRAETPRPSKRWKSEDVPSSPQQAAEENLEKPIDQSPLPGTLQQPMSISSRSSSITDSQPEELPEQDVNVGEDDANVDLQVEALMDQEAAQKAYDGSESIASSSDFDMGDLEPIPPPPKAPSPLNPSDELPSNTPTPRPQRHKTPNFDTQAILSSPIPSTFQLSALPRPGVFSQDENNENDVFEGENKENEDDEDDTTLQNPIYHYRPTSPDREQDQDPQSDDSSMLEFRDYSMNNIEEEAAHDPDQSSQASISSTNSKFDPYPLLEPSEIQAFFAEQRLQNHTNDEIRIALRHTHVRPDLAVEVLEAWGRGEKLPTARGIWSEEDDRDLEATDARELQRLERKHGYEGWGGIDERRRFLDQLRQRRGA